jgi:prepilin-type N-terminal cleavage/methylation domain-containing protein
MRNARAGFTLAELLVSIAILVALVLLVSRLFLATSTIATFGIKRIDTDGQVRPLFERLAVDFAQMVKRTDVDYYFKSVANAQPGNDQMAFYSAVPGYYPSTGSQSPLSLVAYRVNGQNTLERMAKGLLWNAVSPTSTPVVFFPTTISASWPTATGTGADADYESIAPYVFRFEYYYILKNGTLSVTPWDTSSGHTTISGFQDVAAVSICIAAVDSKSRLLTTESDVATLTGTMNDFSASMNPGDLLAQWQSALYAANNIPRPTLSAVRLYERTFALVTKP